MTVHIAGNYAGNRFEDDRPPRPPSTEEQFRQLQAEMERRAHPPSENADDIDKARTFTAELKITLAGRDFPLRPTGGLIALLRYVSRGTTAADGTDGERGQAALAGMYDLLHDSIAASHWSDFEHHATKSKVAVADLEPCIRQLIEAYTARPYWPGMRLLATAAANMADLDGAVLMGTGRGIATFTAREVCNLMLARMLQGQSQDDRDVFLEDLYLDYSPEAIAMGQVQQMMAEKAKAKLAAEEAASAGAGAVSEPAGEGPAGDTGAGPGTEGETSGAAAEDHGDSAVDAEAGGPADRPGGPEQPEP